jgi:integral membrane protein (TIGR01906 family)
VAGLLLFLIARDFTAAFTVFHEIFFRNDLWILDPRTSLLIQIVPEPFFMDIALRIGVGYLAGVACAVAGCWRYLAKSRQCRGTAGIIKNT